MSNIEANFPFHQAAKSGKVNVLKDLLAKGADKNEKNNKGQTPLIVAVIERHLNVVRCLLEEGAEKDEADTKGTTPPWLQH